MAVRYISNINARRTLFPTQQHGAQFISTILQIHSAVRTSDNRTMARPRGTHVHCNHVAFPCPCSTYYGCIIAEWSPFVSPCPSTDTSDAVSVHNKTVNTDLSYEFARVASAIGLFSSSHSISKGSRICITSLTKVAKLQTTPVCGLPGVLLTCMHSVSSRSGATGGFSIQQGI